MTKSNAEKSKCIIHGHGTMVVAFAYHGDPNVCQFFLDGQPIEYVKSYIHVHFGRVVIHIKCD